MNEGQYQLCPMRAVYEEEVTMYQIDDVLDYESLFEIKSYINTIPMEYIANDLGRYRQSRDLDGPNNNVIPAFNKIVQFLKTKVRHTVENLFRLKTRSNITATVSKYTKGDYLLCHDDKVGTRAVAFIMYLNELTEADGGNLRFLCVDERNNPLPGCFYRKFRPTCNTIVLFRVSRTSYHEVEQVFTDVERITINGWFHYEEPSSEDDIFILNPYSKSEIVNLTMPVNPIMAPNKILNVKWLLDETVNDMKSHFTSTGEMFLSINDSLKKEFFQLCSTELRTENLLWESKGPANQRFYETIPFEVEGPHVDFGESMFHINNLVDLLLSPQFIYDLSKITGLTYRCLEDNAVPPTCMIEVQRWKEGNYSVLSDNNIETDMDNVEVTIFFNVNNKLIESADSGTELSGIMVHTVKPPKITSKKAKHLHMLRLMMLKRRVKAELPKRKHKLLKNRRFLKKLDLIAQKKADRIKKYRNSSVGENSYLIPKENKMFISVGSKTCTRYTSYIKKRSAFAIPRVCYHAVSVTYFTTT